MSTDAVQAAVKENAKVLANSPVLLEASAAIAEIPEDLVINTDADDARWGDVARKASKAAKHIEGSLTDLFRPLKTFEKLLRDHFKATYIAPLTTAVGRIDKASLRHRQEKSRIAEMERRQAEEAAARAAEAAAREAQERAAAQAAGQPVEEPEFEDAPGVAQTLVPVVEKVVRSEDTATFEVRTLECVMEDEAEAKMNWPSSFLFDEATCLGSFKRLEAHRFDQHALDVGVVVGGVRFKNKIAIRRRDR